MAALVPFEVASDGASLRGSLHLPDDHLTGPQSAVLICRGIPMQSSEAGGYFEVLIHRLTNAGLVVASYEHRCAGLILEDYHAFSPTNDVSDLRYIWRWLSANDHVERSKLTLLAFGVGAVPAAQFASTTDHPPARLVLVNPFNTETIRRLAGARTDNGSHGEELPRAVLESLDELSPTRDAAGCTRPTLVLQAAADTVTASGSAEEYMAAYQTAGQSPEFIYISRADHRFSDQESQEACISCVLEFLDPLLQPVESR